MTLTSAVAYIVYGYYPYDTVENRTDYGACFSADDAQDLVEQLERNLKDESFEYDWEAIAVWQK